MIELLSESLEGLSAAMIAELGRYRHQVFIEKLGWDVVSTSRVRDQEFDQFDHPQTRYIVAMSRQGICGCARLLPTTDAYLLRTSSPTCAAKPRRAIRRSGSFRATPPARRTIRSWR